MTRVWCAELPGIRMFFVPGDHEPPHMHAVRPGHWHVKVYFEAEASIDVKSETKGFTGKDRNALAKVAREHRLELVEEWAAHHGPEEGSG